MTTLPLTDWIGSMTTATARGCKRSNDCCVFMSTLESQQPKPGCEWYHPTTISGLRESGPRRDVPSAPPGLLEHVHHLRLVDGIDRLDRDTCARLRHRKDIDDAAATVSLQLRWRRCAHGVLVHELAEH